jgi:site-specific recombinase XerD
MDADELVSAFMFACSARRLARKTVEKYRYSLALLPRPYLPSTPDDVYAALHALQGRGLSPETVHTVFTVWKTFYLWIDRRHPQLHLMAWDGQVSPPARGARLPRVFSAAELARIAAACLNERDRALVQVALDTGARTGEIAALRKASVRDGTLVINSAAGDKPACRHCETMRGRRQEGGKSGERVVPVSETTASMLLALGDDFHVWTRSAEDNSGRDALIRAMAAKGDGATDIARSIAIFGYRPLTEARIRAVLMEEGRPAPARAPLTYSGVMQAYKRILRRAGISGPRSGPHTLRHTFATEFLRRGGSLPALQRILGHADVSTTQIYMHLLMGDLRREHSSASPAIGLWDIPQGGAAP